jgi:anaerobic ribonucleoside-triphosphate reductase activating protein
MTKLLNIAKRLTTTTVEGPGKRYVLWMQGCNVGCRDCCNQDMLPFEPRQIVSTDIIRDEILGASINHQIEGITLLGGEPTLQAVGLSEIADFCIKQSLSVFLFTGLKLDRLRELRRTGVDALLSCCDVVVDGPFLPTKPDKLRNWVGSTNQQFHYLTSFYDSSIETNQEYSPAIEIHVRTDTSYSVIGSPFLVNQ